jgi:hypothetical protein
MRRFFLCRDVNHRRSSSDNSEQIADLNVLSRDGEWIMKFSEAFSCFLSAKSTEDNFCSPNSSTIVRYSTATISLLRQGKLLDAFATNLRHPISCYLPTETLQDSSSPTKRIPSTAHKEKLSKNNNKTDFWCFPMKLCGNFDAKLLV